MKPALVSARDGSVTAFDCLMVAGSTKGARHCMLFPNRSQLAGLQKLADETHAACTVTDGVWLGSGGNPPIRRYEATCREGPDYIFDAPQPGSSAGLAAGKCGDPDMAGIKCVLASPKG